MKNCYINGVGSVTIQNPDFDVLQPQSLLLQNINKAQQPSYKELIAPAMSRRMAKGVKMSIYAANKAMLEARMVDPQAIVVGTGLGCIEDSEKFLDAIIENDEQYLTPTAFIQSTHNTVAAQIALQLQCKAYNFTYVNGANSFENALFDALMQLKHFNKETVLVGGVDEIAPYTFAMFEMVGKVKSEHDAIDFKHPETNGIPLAEGANFFALSDKISKNTYAEIADVWLFNEFKNDERTTITEFLSKNQLTIPEIDVVVFGANADASQQGFYDKMQEIFVANPQAYYQHLSGSYDTASAFGLRVAAEMIFRKKYPEHLKYNDLTPKKIETILLINQNKSTDFSFVLLRKC